MTQRSRKSNNYNESAGGGNVLFTLGLVSVVALLVVGYVMTQGGVKSLAENGLSKISLVPTATPAAAPTLTAPANGPMIDEIIQKYEKELKQQQERYEQKIAKLSENYETQITDLKTQIQLLNLRNKKK